MDINTADSGPCRCPPYLYRDTLYRSGAGHFLTVIFTFTVLPLPSCAVQVITQVPGALAVTLPVLLTVATDLSLVDHFTFWLTAVVGVTFLTESWRVAPFLRVALVLLRVIFETCLSLTVISQEAEAPQPEARPVEAPAEDSEPEPSADEWEMVEEVAEDDD